MYSTKIENSAALCFATDDMFLTKDLPTTAGSKMLDGYMSLFDAETITLLQNAGYTLCGKAKTGEFAIDLVGETNKDGVKTQNGELVSPVCEIINSGDTNAALCLDVNGYPCRAAAQNGLVCIKATYGTVSRYGTIPTACSGETVSVLGKTAGDCRKILKVIKKHDDKDGTSLPSDACELKESKPFKKVAVLTNFVDTADDAIKSNISAFCDSLKANGVEVCQISSDIIAKSNDAWNILMSAELCNNVSRYDGVKYGYRAKEFTDLDSLYVNSRTEAFSDVVKTVILFGSETLSTDNYMRMYDKALRVRRVIKEEFAKIFESFDAVILPAASKTKYTNQMLENDKYLAFSENFYTAPASITGLPALVTNGVQVIGNEFCEGMLLESAELIGQEASK